eukprot:scaffold582_cov73-Cylindrotheca_fusiformis.AAC.1
MVQYETRQREHAVTVGDTGTDVKSFWQSAFITIPLPICWKRCHLPAMDESVGSTSTNMNYKTVNIIYIAYWMELQNVVAPDQTMKNFLAGVSSSSSQFLGIHVDDTKDT